MRELNKIAVGHNPQPTQYRKKSLAMLTIATTEMTDYSNHPMQSLSLREIFPYLSKNKKGNVMANKVNNDCYRFYSLRQSSNQ